MSQTKIITDTKNSLNPSPKYIIKQFQIKIKECDENLKTLEFKHKKEKNILEKNKIKSKITEIKGMKLAYFNSFLTYFNYYMATMEEEDVEKILKYIDEVK